jgi:class 3 adenylate cyclase/tetratricopeptide (TPR) repeat protein
VQPRLERKFVTVVFCDLVGFTGRAEAMDPEDVGAMLTTYHHRLRDELERYGGTVEKFIGDAVVAVFGAPTVHEDDAERAVRAAIAIRDWALDQVDVDVRIAVNSGEALVSVDADAAAGEGLVAGDVINTASRMQGAAPVNGILVGEQTYRATRDVITYHDAEQFAARGKTNPINVRVVDSARSRTAAGAVIEPRGDFVGRDRELALLKDAFERVRSAHEPQLVTLIAVPGAGKSRLVYELSRVVDADPDLVSWRQAHCLPYGDGVSFWALAEIVKGESGILENDAPHVAAAKLGESVRALLPATDVEWVERDLRPLIGLVEGTSRDGARADAAFPAWQRYLEALAERGPCVLVVEDLHSADDGLLDFLDDFAAGCTGLPMLLLTTARPELLDHRPQWGGGKTNSTTLTIPPLTEVDTARIVQMLLGRAALPAALQQHLLDRAGGNPLFAEEFARMVAERGDVDLAVPETVQGIIAARLDALDPRQKQLLQDASVFGTTFWLGAVVSMGSAERRNVENDLRLLEQREFIRRDRRSSVDGEVEYAFRHGLIRDAAYGQLPRAERGERHRRAASWIASLGRAEDHAELVAHHYLEAIGYLRAAGGDVTQWAAEARGPLREAGERALRLAAYAQAVRYLAVAVEFTPADGAERPELLYRYGLARVSADSTGEETLAEAIDLLRASGKPEFAARAALFMARIAWNRNDRVAFDEAMRVVDDLTAQFPQSIVRLEALVARSGYAMVAGDYGTAAATATDALDRTAGMDRPDLHARALDIRGTSRSAMGDPRGFEDARQAIDIARASGAIWEMHYALNNMITGAVQAGLTSEVRVLLDEWKSAFDEVGGTHFSRQWYLAAEAEYFYCNGDWDAVLDYLGQFLAGIPEGQVHYIQANMLAMRAFVLLGRGQDALARADTDLAMHLSRDAEDAQSVAPVLCVRGLIMAATGRLDEARSAWAALMRLGDVLPNTLSQGDMPGFAWLAVDLDKRQEALEIIERCESPDWVSVGRSIVVGEPEAAVDVLKRLGRLSDLAYTQLRAGGSHVRDALHFFESVGATRFAQQALDALEPSA